MSTGDMLLLSLKEVAPYAASCLIHFSVFSSVVSVTTKGMYNRRRVRVSSKDMTVYVIYFINSKQPSH